MPVTFQTEALMKLYIPSNYKSILTLKETERAIKMVKDFFELNLAAELKLRRVTAPLFVQRGTGINDDLNGTENPISTVPTDHLSVMANFQSTVGVRKLAEEQIYLYPNPVTEGRVTLLAEDPMDQISLFLYDVNGREIKRIRISNQRSKLISMDLDPSLSGIYILKLSARNHTSFFKLMVQ